MDKIKFTHLRRFLTCQKYFIWNGIEKLNITQEEIDEDQFTFQIPSTVDTINLSNEITAVQVRTFNKVERMFYEYIKPMGRVAFIKATTPFEEKLKDTKKFLLDSGVDIIFNPVFEYNGAIASPTFYDKRTKKISNLKISASTKRIDLIKPYFDFQIATKSGTEVQEISYFILDTKKYKAFELGFYETFKVNTSAGSRSSKELKEISDFVGIRALKSGNGKNKKGQPYEIYSIFDIVAKYNPITSRDIVFQFDSIDFYLRNIKEAIDIEYEGKPTLEDANFFGKNPFINDLINHLKPEFAHFNGKLINSSEILEGKTMQDFSNNSNVVKSILKDKVVISNKEALKEIINRLEKTRVVWYDFEGFSLPFPTIDGYNPFQQATFQVSTIETIAMKEKETINTVFDPQTFNYTDFPKLIEQIYANAANAYVVYNQGYENSRLKEMIIVLQENDHPQWKKCHDMVTHIIENTVDLADPFTIKSKDILPPILIPDLKGRYSIKLIEKYITKENFEFSKLITPYSDLEIQNGGMAMDAAINRAINVLKEKEWEERKDKLKEYCENDVRAMIMVYELIKHLNK